MRLLLIILILSSCSTEKRCMRHIEKAKKLGCLTFTDSVNIRDSVSIHLDSQIVVSSVDSILNIIVCDSLTDTLYLTRVKERIKTIVSNIPCEISPTAIGNKYYTLKMWVENGKLMYEFDLDKLPMQPCPEIKWYNSRWFWFISGFLTCFLLIGIFIRILQFKPTNNTH